ncbi:MAG TPA: pitrilysin family protein [Candidatus Sulfotelmatobacter sp.]|nr:pitrilysin family protein [Candidatus Sulfotelmatobacter sp.]
MQARLSAAFLAALFLVSVAPVPGAARDFGTDDTDVSTSLSAVQVRTLDNGLRVVVVEDHAAPVAEVEVWYRFGSADETPGKTGLAHALEHMMFRGTTTLSAGALDEWTAGLGASINAQTTTESTHFEMQVPADRLEPALRIEADRMQHLALDPEAWDKERGAVLQEAAQDRSNPYFTLHERMLAKMYPNSPLGQTSLGAKADVERATVADLRAYYEQWYAPNDATLVVAGDVDPATVFAQAQQWFGPIPTRPLPAPRFSRPTPAHDVVEQESADVPFTVVDLAYAIPPPTGPTHGDALRAIIGGVALAGNQGQLKSALFESRLTLGYFVQPALDRDIASIHLIAVVAPGHTADEVRSIMTSTLHDLTARGLPADDVDAAKRAALAQLVYARDSIASLASTFGGSYAFPQDPTPAQDAQTIAGITRAEINGMMRGIFAEPNAVGIIEPTTTDLSKLKAPTAFEAGRNEEFGGRVPDGPIVEPDWLRADAARPLTLHSTVAPIRTSLPNGLQLLIQRVPGNSTVFISGAMRRSPAFDPPGKTGTGLLASALLNAGSQHYQYDGLQRVGKRLGATLSYGSTFSAHGYARDLPALLNALADDVRNPLLPADRFALLKAQMSTSLSRQILDPTYRARRAFLQALYPTGDPELREMNVASLDAITIDDVRTYAKTYDRPDLTTLVVVGDVDPAAARTAVERAFGGWKADGPTPSATLKALPLPAPQEKYIENGDAQDVTVELGQPAPKRGDPDADAFLIADSLLDDQSFESRLFQEIRQKRGLVYTVGTHYRFDGDRGTWTATFRAVPSKVDAADALILDQVKRLETEPVDVDELHRCETRQVAREILAEQATRNIAGDLLAMGLENLPTNYQETLAARYGAVTPADVQRAAREYFHPDHWVEVRTGPPSDTPHG